MHTRFGLCLTFSLASFLPLLAEDAPSLPRLEHPSPPQVFYFVLTDRFANGTAENDRGGIEGGRERDGFDPTVISHYHGGDFVGLTDKLDYLQNLGISAIWVTPPFTNKAVQSGTAGYHGYWITDFLSIDPHLGTNEEFRSFVSKAQQRGIRVFLDIIVNHTADVITPEGGTAYRPEAAYPWRDAAGTLFDEGAHAYNGFGNASFPELSVETSFAYRPTVTPEEARIKNPAWLNDLSLYHNRGNTTFQGENSLHGDFVGLDDLFTEHPRVVQGMIDIFSHWVREYRVNGFRLDTARHVNPEFWEAFCPAIHTAAREAGRPDFLLFGEVYNDEGDPSVLAEYSTQVPIDTSLDFGFFRAARYFLSRQEPSTTLAQFFRDDDYYTDHDSNVYVTPTFLGNHDAGRFGHFLRADNPRAGDAELLSLMKLGHALLFLARGQPVIYYGDEQGMTGTGGDMAAREDMFASLAPHYQRLALIGTTRRGMDEKFDPTHPLYLAIRELSDLRKNHRALREGSMRVHDTGHPSIAAFSRIHREEGREYLAVFNAHRTEVVEVRIKPSSGPDSRLTRVYGLGGGTGETLTVSAENDVVFTLPPLSCVLWRAQSPLAPRTPGGVRLSGVQKGGTLAVTSRVVDGITFPTRHEIQAEVEGGDGFGEVTFLLSRTSRAGEYTVLGTDDAPPYRVFWTPAADQSPDERFSVIAVYDSLRGHKATARVDDLRFTARDVQRGISGSIAPRFTRLPAAAAEARAGEALTLRAEAEGSAPLLYQWQKDGRDLPGQTKPTLEIRRAQKASAGTYLLRVRNVAGTTVSSGTHVRVREP